MSQSSYPGSESEANGIPVVKVLPIARLNLTAAAECRDNGEDRETIDRYADAMDQGAVFPPVVVFDDGTTLHLADGKKRVLAARRIGQHNIRATVHEGGLRDAILYAAGANLTHGVASSQADKRRAVKAVLRVASDLSDREIGRRCGVDHKTVATVRRELTGEIPQSSLRTGADGRTIDVSGIGARPPADADESYVGVIWAELNRAIEDLLDESDDPDLSDLFDEPDEPVELRTLSPEEKARLREYERKITESMKKYAVVIARMGRDAAIIRDKRSYRDEYETFDAFCEGEFGDSAEQLKIALASHDSLSRSPTGARALAMALSIADEDAIGTAKDPQ